uniref:Uncharacterized protein n=1 Tax=Arundo donax TaxID=35708 RepID=A0A0A9BW23_ARUDO
MVNLFCYKASRRLFDFEMEFRRN